MITILTGNRRDAIRILDKNISIAMNNLDITHQRHVIDTQRYSAQILNLAHVCIQLIKLKINLKKKDPILITDQKSILSIFPLITKNPKFIYATHIDDKPFFYKILRLNYKKHFEKFDSVFCLSEFTRNQLIEQDVDKTKLLTVYPGVDHSIFYPRNTKPKTFPKRFIISIGSEQPRKNMKNIIRAFKIAKEKHSNLVLVHIGMPSEPKNREETKKIIHELELQNDVKFTGHIPVEKIAEYYSQAELLLFPSFLEGFGLPIVEAMSCGCPVVTSNRNPMKELVKDTQVLVEPESAQNISEGIEKVLSSKKMRNNMRKQGLARSQDFKWEKTAKKIQIHINKNDKQQSNSLR